MHNSDSTTISIQFQVAGRSVLLRNALIGLILGISFASLAATRYWMSPVVALLAPSIGGAAIGGFTALMALFGQMAAPHPYEGQRRILWPAIRYAGLIAGSVGVFITGLAVVGSSQHSFGSVLLITFAGAVIGALIMAVLTLILTAMKRVIPQRSAALLGERQFDPLQHIESREHARR